MPQQKAASLLWEAVPRVAASGSSGSWEAGGKGGCVVLGKPVPHTGSRLCGHKTASLASRLFHSKQVLSGAKQPLPPGHLHCCVTLGAQQDLRRGQRRLERARKSLPRLPATATDLERAALCSARARAASIRLCS